MCSPRDDFIPVLKTGMKSSRDEITTAAACNFTEQPPPPPRHLKQLYYFQRVCCLFTFLSTLSGEPHDKVFFFSMSRLEVVLQVGWKVKP